VNLKKAEEPSGQSIIGPIRICSDGAEFRKNPDALSKKKIQNPGTQMTVKSQKGKSGGASSHAE